jgi:general secretion pathway protein H
MRGQSTAGFTLLEMLVVLAIIAAASVLAMAAFGDGLRGARLQSAAKEVAAQLRFTRAVAIASGVPQDFVIDPRARAWRAPNGRHGRLPDTGELVFTGARDLGPTAGEGAVRFFPDGAATGGRVRLAASGGGWDVDIAWLTGEVRVHRIGGAP